jgi:DNA-binding transcriptional regulator YiaG
MRRVRHASRLNSGQLERQSGSFPPSHTSIPQSPGQILRGYCWSPLVTLIPALPFCHAELRAQKPQSEHYPREIKRLGDHIRARRLDLKLLQRQVAEQIGVNGATITNWERNASTPVTRYIPAIIRFLGYDPAPPPTSLPDRLVAVRRKLGLTQREMAERVGVDPCSLRDWESGHHRPTGKSLNLIGVVLGNVNSG